MAKQPKNLVPVETGTEVVEDLHPTVEAEDGAEFTDVTGKDDLPLGVADPNADEEEPATPPTKPAAKKSAAPAEDEVPEEFKGKTQAQIVKMLKDAQTLIGRQGQELGDLRRAADTYIKHSLTQTPQAAKPAPAADVPADKGPDDVDFFTNPAAAIARAVANHPAIKALEGASKDTAARELTRQRTENFQRFSEAHPDAKEVLADPEFQAWVEKSAVRKQMIVRAHRNYDLHAGMEVFNTWKELKAARAASQPAPAADAATTPAAPVVKPAASKQAAKVPTSGNPSPRTPGSPSQKIYRRADVIKLMQTDPQRYELMSDEITKAYQEGRVR